MEKTKGDCGNTEEISSMQTSCLRTGSPIQTRKPQKATDLKTETRMLEYSSTGLDDQTSINTRLGINVARALKWRSDLHYPNALRACCGLVLMFT